MSPEHTSLHALAHDLRNALSSVYSYAQILEMSLSKTGSENELEIVRALVESAENMDAIITERVAEMSRAATTAPVEEENR